jgi:hypothetical protein
MTREEIDKTIERLDKLIKRLNEFGSYVDANICMLAMDLIRQYQEALEFYADPETYFGIGIIADRPTGGFDDDIDDDYEHTDMTGPRPGKLARKTLGISTR